MVAVEDLPKLETMFIMAVEYDIIRYERARRVAGGPMLNTLKVNVCGTWVSVMWVAETNDPDLPLNPS